jgi:hypothetical protein
VPWVSHHCVEELASVHNLCVGPFRGKILHIAGHQVVSTRSLGALQKNVIIGIRTSAHLVGGLNPKGLFTNGAKGFLDFAIAPI